MFRILLIYFITTMFVLVCYCILIILHARLHLLGCLHFKHMDKKTLLACSFTTGILLKSCLIKVVNYFLTGDSHQGRKDVLNNFSDKTMVLTSKLEVVK